MRFHLTAEHEALQHAVSGALAGSWPLARLQAFADAQEDHDPASWRALADVGVPGMLCTADAGGAGMGLVEAALVCELIGSHVAPGPVADHILTALAIERSTNEAAKSFLPGLVSGATPAAFAFRGFPEQWQDKTVLPVQSASAAAFFLLGTEGGGLDLVPAGDAVAIRATPSTDLTRKLSEVSFDRAERLTLFPPGHPFVTALFDAALVLKAADALGGAQRCLDMTLAYAKDRVQFDQPIGGFQAVKHQLADLALQVEPSRALLWYAAHAWDSFLPESPRMAALASAHLADRFMAVARAAVTLHGGIGYTWDYGLHHWLRRAIFDFAWLGSPSVHRARSAAMAGW